MPGMDFPVFFSHLDHFKTPRLSSTIRQRLSLAILFRALRGALVFIMLLFFPVLAPAADVTLAWDANSETDLEGYGVYFRKDTPGPPYDLFGNITLQELTDPDNPTFTMTGLEKGSRYYFTVTAYDTEGNESEYAVPVCADIGDQIVPCASAINDSGIGSSSSATGSGGSNGGGSGGGAGCFIETSMQHHPPISLIVTLLPLGAVFLIGYRKFLHKKAINIASSDSNMAIRLGGKRCRQ